MRTSVIAAGLILLALPATAPAQVPLGPEFRSNVYTPNWQNQAKVASDADGNFVVVWTSQYQDGDGDGIFARRYLASGTPVSGAEFRVNTYTLGIQLRPDVASDSTGRVVVVWGSVDQDGSSVGVYGKRFDAAGSPGPEFRVNTTTASYQHLPAVAMALDGSFIVVWEGAEPGGQLAGIFGQRYDSAGAPQGGEFHVNTYTTGDQRDPAVAMDAAGNFVVAWMSLHDGSYNGGIFAQRYDGAATPQGTEFRVNTETAGSQDLPSMAMAPDGKFVIAWRGPGAGGDSYEIVVQRYDALGQPQGGEFRVNEFTTGIQDTPAVAMDAAGGFTVVWSDTFMRDGSGDGVFARSFDTFGTPRGGDFAVNAYTTHNQSEPAIAATANGRFVVTWASANQDGGALGVFGRRFAHDPIFQDGFESGDLTAWSNAETDGGDLNVSSSAAMKFSLAGVQAVVDDTAGLFVEDGSPENEDSYRARFYFDTHGFDPGEALNHRRIRLFLAFEEAPLRRLAAIVLRRLGGAYSVMLRARLDDNSQSDSSFYPISDGAHFIELEWTRSSGPDANNGTFSLWIDGTSVFAGTGIDNSLSSVDLVRLGALSVKTGAAGTLYFDEFVSHRLNPIGP